MSPKEVSRRNVKAIASPDVHRKTQAYILKMRDAYLNQDAYILAKTIDQDPNNYDELEPQRLADAL